MAKREGKVTVYTAKKIITMDRARPEVTTVAVLDGKILSAGDMKTLKPWLEQFDYEVDDTFKNKVIAPGFIDPHVHNLISGIQIMQNYVGYFDLDTKDGGIAKGYRTREAVLDRLGEIEKALTDPDEMLLANGFEPAYFGGDLHRDELDQISSKRPIWVMGYAPHVCYVNSAFIELMGVADSDATIGVGHYEDGRLNGVFAEVLAEQMTFKIAGPHFAKPGYDPIQIIGKIAHRGGVTMIDEMALGSTGIDREYALFDKIVNGDPDFPIRVGVTPLESECFAAAGDDGPGIVRKLQEKDTDKLFTTGVKFLTDGSVPVTTLKLGWPHYLDGSDGNTGDIPWDKLHGRMRQYWEDGIRIHVHANGDSSIDATLDALERLQNERPRFNHRFTIEHYVISNTEQARRCADLGACVSMNVTYVNTRASQYQHVVMGPDRTESMMGRAGSLVANNVTFAFHSDYVLVPLSPLLHITTAVTRKGYEGNLHGPGEAISVERAMRAVTIDAAYILEKEKEYGSIEVGKFADFVILEESPFDVAPEFIKDIKIWGTVLAGKKQPFKA